MKERGVLPLAELRIVPVVGFGETVRLFEFPHCEGEQGEI